LSLAGPRTPTAAISARCPTACPPHPDNYRGSPTGTFQPYSPTALPTDILPADRQRTVVFRWWSLGISPEVWASTKLRQTIGTKPWQLSEKSRVLGVRCAHPRYPASPISLRRVKPIPIPTEANPLFKFYRQECSARDGKDSKP